MKQIFYLAIVFFSVFQSCTQTEKQDNDTKSYTYKIYKTENSSFGYDIYKDSTLIIHQPIVPGISGNSGFKNEDDAGKVANLMVSKLSNGIMPPSITLEEMDSLEINTN